MSDQSSQDNPVDWLQERGSTAGASTPETIGAQVFELDDSLEDGIVRVKIRRDGHRTSVSLDEMYYRAGVMLLGGTKLFEAWIQDQVNILDIRWAERASMATTGDQVKPKAGRSRLIQRRLLQLLIQKLEGKPDGTA